ncbi:MAG: 50S ribosomal protein L17 [Candidatus Gracilibacteria bacterium]|jgi:large subunit ribosomal protein L17
MRHKVKKIKLGINKAYGKALLKNLAMSVIIYEKVKTTMKKAKSVQPMIEKLINTAKKKEKVIAIREIEKVLNHENSSRKLIEVLKEKYKDVPSGYTRITKIGARKGDNAPLVQIELV